MRPDQCKTGCAVIEGRCIPTERGMTLRTVRRAKSSTGSRVHGIIGLLPGCQVALRIAAIRRLDRKTVVAVDMAEGALHVGVAIRQQKSRGAVIEPSIRPFGDGVACGARRRRGREARGDVIGHAAPDALRSIPIRGVARHAIGAAQRVIVVHMALHTGSCGVRADQRKAGGVVIECRA